MNKNLALVYGENPTPFQKYYLKNGEEINRKRREKYKQTKDHNSKCVIIERDIVEIKLDQIESNHTQIETRLTQIESNQTKLESKLTQIESNQSKLETKLTQIKSKLETKLAQIELDINKILCLNGFRIKNETRI